GGGQGEKMEGGGPHERNTRERSVEGRGRAGGGAGEPQAWGVIDEAHRVRRRARPPCWRGDACSQARRGTDAARAQERQHRGRLQRAAEREIPTDLRAPQGAQDPRAAPPGPLSAAAAARPHALAPGSVTKLPDAQLCRVTAAALLFLVLHAR